MSHKSRNTRHQTRLLPHHCLTPRRAAGRSRPRHASRDTGCPLLPAIARLPRCRKSSARITAFPSRKPQPHAPRITKHETRITRRGFAHHCPLLPAIAGSPVAANQVSAHSHPFSVGLGCRKTKNRHPRRACRQVTDSPLTTAHYCLLLLTTACYCPPLPGKKFPQIECPRTVIHSRAVSVTKSAKNALAHSVGLAGFLWSFGSVAGSPGQSLHGYGIARMLC